MKIQITILLHHCLLFLSHQSLSFLANLFLFSYFTVIYQLLYPKLFFHARGPKQVKFSAIVIAVLMLSSWIASFTIAMKWNYIARVEEPFALFDQLYDKPWLRIGPYLIGIMAGYLLFRVDCKISMSPFVLVIGWVSSLVCLTSLVYGLGRDGLVVPASAFYVSCSNKE